MKISQRRFRISDPPLQECLYGLALRTIGIVRSGPGSRASSRLG